MYITFDNKKIYLQSPKDFMLNGYPWMTLPFLRESQYLLLRLVKGSETDLMDFFFPLYLKWAIPFL